MSKEDIKRKKNSIFIDLFIICVMFGLILNSLELLDTNNSLVVKVHNTTDSSIPLLENTNLLILVNREVKLPNDYKLALESIGSHEVSRVLIDDLEEMVKVAEKDFVYLKINTAYRSIEEQQMIWDNSVQSFLSRGYSYEQAILETRKTVLEPGFSEHHTGLAIDFSKPGDYVENKKMWDWLEKNAYKYGFILRYPVLKENITGIAYEPWHYRYVGKDNSIEIYKLGLSLEEYLMIID